MKTGRNEQCVCGSGKKYKRCCFIKEVQTSIFSKEKYTVKESFFRKYNSIDLLQSIAGLSILKENHGKNLRFEIISDKAIEHFNENAESVDFAELKNFITDEYPREAMEDHPFNLLTELVIYHGGNYLIFPGINDSNAFLLNNLLKAVTLNFNDKLPVEFTEITYKATMLILKISDSIAKDVGYTRYQVGDVDRGFVQFPSEESFNLYKNALVIPYSTINRLLLNFNINSEILKAFILDISNANIDIEGWQNSPLINKPIINYQDKFVVASPTNLSQALVGFIKDEAKRLGCYELLVEVYYDFIWHDLQLKLDKIGFKYHSNDDSNNKFSLPSRYGIYRFDDDKIAIIYLKHKGQKDMQSRDAIIKAVSNTPKFKGYDIFEISVVSGFGEEFIMGLEQIDSVQTLMIVDSEINIISDLGDVDAIELYKFAIADEKARDSFIMPSSFIDKFKFYLDKDHSFYYSDKSKSSITMIEPGFGFDLLIKSKYKVDLHAVQFKENESKLVQLIEVVKKDKYVGTYLNIKQYFSGELYFLIEIQPVYIWISPLEMLVKKGTSLKNMYWKICDAIAYWLWQLDDIIKIKISSLDEMPIKITFDFNDVEKFAEITRNFAREEGLFDKFRIKSTNDSFNITIPYQILPYLYGVDNDGERQLVKAILIGLNGLLDINSINGFSDEEITYNIERIAPKGTKKMIYILDTTDNIMLDPQFLTGYRIVQQYDVNVVLDTIVPLLGNEAPEIGNISTKSEKKNLTSIIVQKALLPYLRSKIRQYNSTELLIKLISVNEALIYKREKLRINIPTRIACFGSIEKYTQDLANELANELADLDKSNLSIRCLIEHLAAEPYKGSRTISTMAIDELIAIMAQILKWGSLGDEINFELLNVELSVLPSNRIGIKKENIDEIFASFQKAKANENIIDAVDSYENVFPQRLTIEEKAVPSALENAFISDYGITFSRLCEFVNALVIIGFQQEDACSILPLKELNMEVNKHVNKFSSDEFKIALEFLSLSDRGKVDNKPSDEYDYIDVIPWRYNRMLSLLRKPLVVVNENGENVVYWGIRQLFLSRITWNQQLLSGRFRTFENSKVVKVIGKFANERGDDLVRAVLKSINPTNLLIYHDVYIRPNAPLHNEVDIGDIDVLIIEKTKKIIYSLECKSMSPSRNTKEMVEEITKLFGENSSKKGWIEKHMIRHEWLQNNLDTLGKVYKVETDGYTVKSFFVTKEEMFTPHLRKKSLPLPFITLYDLEKYGFEALEKNYDHQIKK